MNRAYRIPPNLFGISFGLAGLAGVWRASQDLVGAPPEIANGITLTAAAVWLVLLVVYLSQGIRRLWSDLRDPIFCPFVALIGITGMLLAAALADQALPIARVLVVVFLVQTLTLGAWLTGQWIVGELAQDSIHPGYFLPTVAGGLIGAACCAQVHLPGLAQLAFGIGILCWVMLGSILLNRLFFRPVLPAALVPTLAIELAPPAVGGVAYFAITGGSTDTIAAMLAGYAVLMALVQLRFVPTYARLHFGPGFWAFTFSYAAAATDALDWIARTRPVGGTALGVVVVGAITAFVLAIAGRTVAALVGGTFLPNPQPAAVTPGQA